MSERETDHELERLRAEVERLTEELARLRARVLELEEAHVRARIMARDF